MHMQCRTHFPSQTLEYCYPSYHHQTQYTTTISPTPPYVGIFTPLWRIELKWNTDVNIRHRNSGAQKSKENRGGTIDLPWVTIFDIGLLFKIKSRSYLWHDWILPKDTLDEKIYKQMQQHMHNMSLFWP